MKKTIEISKPSNLKTTLNKFEILGIESYLDDWLEVSEGSNVWLGLEYKDGLIISTNEEGFFLDDNYYIKHFALTEDDNLVLVVVHVENNDYKYYEI